MKKLIYYFTILVLFSCNEKEILTVTPITELYPLQVGKIFVYRLDSTVLNISAATFSVRKYLAKDTVESEFLDVSGRKSFRIFRYITDTAKTLPWRYAATYYATFDNDRIEYIDNNLRFITLVNPATKGTNWEGTKYINTNGTGNPFNFLQYWNFSYTNVDESYTVKKGTFPNSYTVLQANDSDIKPTIKTKNFSKEVYAKNVGLIYKDFLHWHWDSITSYDAMSYGIKLELVDYK